MTTTKPNNRVLRNTGKVKATIEWPETWAEWEALPATVRERVRDLLDEAADLVTAYASDPPVNESPG